MRDQEASSFGVAALWKTALRECAANAKFYVSVTFATASIIVTLLVASIAFTPHILNWPPQPYDAAFFGLPLAREAYWTRLIAGACYAVFYGLFVSAILRMAIRGESPKSMIDSRRDHRPELLIVGWSLFLGFVFLLLELQSERVAFMIVESWEGGTPTDLTAFHISHFAFLVLRFFLHFGLLLFALVNATAMGEERFDPFGLTQLHSSVRNVVIAAFLPIAAFSWLWPMLLGYVWSAEFRLDPTAEHLTRRVPMGFIAASLAFAVASCALTLFDVVLGAVAFRATRDGSPKKDS